MKRTAFLLSILLIVSMLSGCTQEAPPAQVAATTLPVYEFTLRICDGTDIKVTRLVTENVSCLHDYSLNVRQVRAAEAAEVVVISGAGLEDFMAELLDGKATVDSSAGIRLLECTEGHEHDHSHDHGHAHEEDPHIWLSPANAKVMAVNICSGLSRQYPLHSDLFAANLNALLADLDALQAYGETQLNDLSCREIITFHDGFAYFAEAFDLTILEAVEEEAGSEASAQELKELITMVRDHSLPAVFTEINGSPSAAEIISASTGAKIFALDMAGESYFDSMYRNIDTIKEALG